MFARARGRAPAVVPAAFIAMLALALPAPAAADPQMEQAFATAKQFWGGNPCGGTVAMRWSDMDPSLNALATWKAAPGAPASTYVDCSIDFNRSVPYDYPRLCTAMLHEVGHLLGQQHTDDPNSPMSHEYLGPVGPCSLGAIPSDAAEDEGDGADEADAEPTTAPRRTVKRTSAKRCKTRFVKRKDGSTAKRRVCRAKRASRR